MSRFIAKDGTSAFHGYVKQAMTMGPNDDATPRTPTTIYEIKGRVDRSSGAVTQTSP